MPLSFELTTDTSELYGETLYRIRATRDIPHHGVKAGDLGGWVASTHTGGTPRISEGAWLAEGAAIIGYARISGRAWVGGHARVTRRAHISGDARVGDAAWVTGKAYVGGHATITGSAVIFKHAHISGDAWVGGNTSVGGYTSLGVDRA